MAFLLLTAYIVILITVWICWSLYKKRHIFKFSRNYKGPTFIPIFGNILQLAYHNVDVAKLCTTMADEFGNCFNLWGGHKYLYVSADADDAKLILNSPKCLNKSFSYDQFKPMFSGTLLIIPGHQWKPRRKAYAKSFKQSILNTFVPTFYKNSELLVKELYNFDQHNLLEITERFSFRNIYENLTSKDCDFDLDEMDEIIKYIDAIQDVIALYLVPSSFIFSIYFLDQLFNGSTRWIWLCRIKKFIHENVITFRRKELQTSPLAADCNLSILDAILSADNKLPDNILTNEITLFISAAFDTTGASLAFTFTLLGMNSAVQAQVFDEVMLEVGSDKSIEADDLPKLKYTERAVLESLRLLPPVILIGREATDDITSSIKTIPKNTQVMINILKLHRNENYWPNPLKFDPDRFLPEQIAKRPTYCYLPFSGGQRNCIGKVYALMSLKVAVANMIRNYEISSSYTSVNDIKLISGISCKPTHPLDCQFKLRPLKSV